MVDQFLTGDKRLSVIQEIEVIFFKYLKIHHYGEFQVAKRNDNNTFQSVILQ